MNTENSQSSHFDLYLTIYHYVKVLCYITILALAIKYALFDTALIRTDQMSPAIQHGDRVLLLRIQYSIPLKFIFHPRCNNPVIFKHPFFTNKTGCLRIAGTPGDIILINNGTFSNIDKPGLSFTQKKPEEVTLPPEYSQRDNMKAYRLPKAGDMVVLDTLGIREFIFFYSILKQENPGKNYSMKPILSIDDSLTSDYFIKDFALYNGMISGIPDTFYNDWFFWDRLEAYLVSNNINNKIKLTFSLLDGPSPVKQYTIKKGFYFLLSDNWYKGYDSRYFGPVKSPSIKGKIIGVLWSFAPDAPGLRALRIRRICKII